MENLGRYQILEQLGSGAMGTVYKARDPMMGRDVAIKTILTSAIGGPQAADFRERFFREARAAGRLAHPGIVTVFDVSEHEGTPFLVMEYVAGRTLQSILESGERLGLDQVSDLSVQLAEALDYAHHSGVIHRDIKPANILITPEGRVKIADFGVARLVDAQATSTGYLLGTPAFMAPEQFTGAPIDGRADIFSAGVVIYWMMTGDKPFSGDSMLSVQYKVVHTDPVPPRKLNPAIPRDFETVILKALAKDPAERYQSGEELATDLRMLPTGQPILPKTAIIDSNDAPTLVMKSKPLSTANRSPASPLSEPQPDESSALVRPSSTIVEAPKPPRTNRWLITMAFIAVFVLGATVASLRMRRRQELATAQSQAAAVENKLPPQPTPAPASTPPSRPAPSAPRAGGPAQGAPPKELAPKSTAARQAPRKPETIALELTAKDRTNVVFEAEGHPKQTLIMQPGESATLNADQQATLIVTNAGALEAKLNGKAVSLGTERRGGRFTVTPEGIDSLSSSTNAKTYIPALPDFTDLTSALVARGTRDALASAARQKELAQASNSVRLLIKSPAIPEFLTLVVRADTAVLFRRDATAPAPEGFDQVLRRFPPGAIQTVPLAEERLIPPGSHQIQVSFLFGAARVGPTQELTADFNSGQRQTLLIELVPESERGFARAGSMPRLRLTLE